MMTAAVLFPPLYWFTSYRRSLKDTHLDPEILRVKKNKLIILAPLAIILLGDIWKYELGFAQRIQENETTGIEVKVEEATSTRP